MLDRLAQTLDCRAAPLARVAVGLILGIWADAAVAPPLWVATAFFALGATVVLIDGRRSDAPDTTKQACGLRIALGLALAAAGLGCVRHHVQYRRVGPRHVVRYAADDRPVLVRVAGEIVSPVFLDPRDDDSHHSSWPREPRTRFDLELDTLHGEQGNVPVTGRVRVTVSAPALHVRPGQRVEVLGRIYRFRGPDNPGQFDWARRQRRDGLLVGLSCSSERNVSVLSPQRGTVRGMLHRLRRSLHRFLVTDAASPDDGSYTLLDAMVLGQRGRVERSLDEAFIQAGVVHFLCASGLHVAWLALGVWAVTFALGAHYRTTAVVSAAVVVGYALVAEPNPPILRAAVTGCLFFAAQWLRRPAKGGNWLAAAAILLLLWNPTDLFDPGFQFSFAIVTGFIVLAPRVLTWLTRSPVTTVGDVVIPPGRSVRGHLLRSITDWFAFLATMALLAWAVAMPIAALHFGRFSPWGWLNALLLSPFVFLVMLLGFAKLLVTAAWPTLGGILTAPLHTATALLAWLANAMARLPGCSLDVPSPGLVWVAAYYVWLVVFIRERARRWLRRLAWPAIIPLTAAWFLPWWAPPRHADELRVWTLSVGNGSATVIELPNGRTLAYDLGTRGRYDAARHTIVPFLRHRAIRRLDAVVVSHPDFDHYGAVEGVAESIPVGPIYLNPHFARLAPDGSAADAFLKAITGRRISILTHRAGDRLPDTGGAAIEVKWPTGEPGEDALSENDTSTVLRIAWQGKSVLLTGDITDAAQAALLQRGDLNSDVLVLPHHGSPRPKTTADFIATVDPSVVIRSSAQADRDTDVSLWSAVGPRAYYSTAESGAVCVIIRAGRIRIETFRPADGRPRSAASAPAAIP